MAVIKRRTHSSNYIRSFKEKRRLEKAQRVLKFTRETPQLLVNSKVISCKLKKLRI